MPARWEEYYEEHEPLYYERLAEKYNLPEPLNREESMPKRKLLTKRRLNTALRNKFQTLFLLIVVFAGVVTFRSALGASRGYDLVKIQQEAQQLEQENERLRMEISYMKSPERIKAIATKDLGMEVPKKVYFMQDKGKKK